MRIDGYAHVVPKDYYEALGEVYRAPAYKRHPETAGFWDYERRVGHLDEYGIDRQVIALGGPHLWPGIREYATDETILRLMRQANDEVRRIADDYPDRFIPIGTLPVLHEEMTTEFRRCLDELDMAGIQIYTNYDGLPVDHERLHGVYDLAVEYDVPLWLHPQVHRWYDWTSQWGVDLAFGWLFDTTLALTRFVLSGLLERYPELDLITHHGGAMIPHFMERTKLFFYEEGTFGKTPEVFEGGYEELTKPIEEYYTQFYADTVLYGSVPALQTLYEVYGADQMVFATDYPYGGHEGQDFMASNVRAMEDLGISADEKAKVYSENLLSLLGR